MPSEDLVEYLIYVASVQVENGPELVGTLENSAFFSLLIYTFFLWWSFLSFDNLLVS